MNSQGDGAKEVGRVTKEALQREKTNGHHHLQRADTALAPRASAAPRLGSSPGGSPRSNGDCAPEEKTGLRSQETGTSAVADRVP